MTVSIACRCFGDHDVVYSSSICSVKWPEMLRVTRLLVSMTRAKELNVRRIPWPSE